MPDIENIQAENYLPDNDAGKDENAMPVNMSENILPTGQSGSQQYIIEQAGTEGNTLNIPTPDIKNMEVHHHPHVEKKNFKEYFLEFLMIFFAVTLGFFAEGLREHFVDSDKEKIYMHSMLLDLQRDTGEVAK